MAFRGGMLILLAARPIFVLGDSVDFLQEVEHRPNSDPKSESRKLTSKIESVASSNKDTRKEVASLAKQNSEMRASLQSENLAMRNKLVKEKLAASIAHQEKLAANVETLKDTGKALKEKTELVRSKNTELAASLTGKASAGTITKNANDKLVAKVASLDASNRDLKGHANKLAKQNRKEKEELKKEQENKLDTLRQQRYESLTNKMEKATDHNKKLEASVESLQKTKKFLNERVKVFQSATPDHASNSVLKRAEAATKESNQQLAAKIAKIDRTSKDKRMQLSDLARGNAEKRNEILKNKITSSKERKEKLASSLDRLQDTNEALTKRASELGKTLSGQKVSAVNPEASTGEIKEKNAQIAAKVAKVVAANKDISRHAGELAEGNTEKRNDILKNKLAITKDRQESLKAAVGRLESVNKNLKRSTR